MEREQNNTPSLCDEEPQNIDKGQKNTKLIEEQLERNEGLNKDESEVIQSKSKKDLMESFNAPFCSYCPKRKADRICINRSCGTTKYMQIICGKCHANEHTNATTKPELDVSEYFLKLEDFQNEIKQNKDGRAVPFVDNRERLQTAVDMIQCMRESLIGLKAAIKKEIQENQSSESIHTILNDSIMKAKQAKEFNQVQEQVQRIKEFLHIDKQRFIINDRRKIFKEWSGIIDSIADKISNVSREISKSFANEVKIRLSELEVLNSISLSFGYTGGIVKGGDHGIKIGPFAVSQSQFYLNYLLDEKKKYRMRFRFELSPKGNYSVVGVMPRSLAENKNVFAVENEYFCKRFFFKDCASFTAQMMDSCTRVVQGVDLCEFPVKGTIIEMRIDISQSYLDFADYPDRVNINANLSKYKLTRGPYVVAFAFLKMQSISIISLEEIDEL